MAGNLKPSVEGLRKEAKYKLWDYKLYDPAENLFNGSTELHPGPYVGTSGRKSLELTYWYSVGDYMDIEFYSGVNIWDYGAQASSHTGALVVYSAPGGVRGAHVGTLSANKVMPNWAMRGTLPRGRYHIVKGSANAISYEWYLENINSQYYLVESKNKIYGAKENSTELVEITGNILNVADITPEEFEKYGFRGVEDIDLTSFIGTQVRILLWEEQPDNEVIKVNIDYQTSSPIITTKHDINTKYRRGIKKVVVEDNSSTAVVSPREIQTAKASTLEGGSIYTLDLDLESVLQYSGDVGIARGKGLLRPAVGNPFELALSVGSYVNIPSMRIGAEVSVCGWINVHNSGIPWSWKAAGYTPPLTLYLAGNRFYNNAGDGTSYPFGNYVFSKYGEYVFVCVVHKKTGAELYIDGELVGVAGYKNPAASNVTVRLNGWSANSYYMHEGSIDEVTIWNKALTKDEILNVGISNFSTTSPDLLGYWKLDEGAGNQIADSSPRGRSGTIVSPNWRETSVERVTLRYFIKAGDDIKVLSGDRWNTLPITGQPTIANFIDHGMTELLKIPPNVFKELGSNFQVIVWTTSAYAPKLVTKLYNVMVKYMVSFDNKATWKSFQKGAWIDVPLDKFYLRGMTKTEIEAVTETQWAEVFKEGVKMHFATLLVNNTLDAVAEFKSFDVIYSDNIPPQIAGSVLGGILKGEIKKDYQDVKYEVKLNGGEMLPLTDYLKAPITMEHKINIDDVNIDSNNNITIIATDEFGDSSTATVGFFGEYPGILFADETGKYYSTHLGRLLKYLDFGIVVAGQTTNAAKVRVINKYDFPIKDISLTMDVTDMSQGSMIQFSKESTPFNPSTTLSFADRLEYNGEIYFHVRLTSQLGAEPKKAAKFKIFVKALPTE